MTIEYEFGDYASFLKSLGDDGARYVLGGGQAVNFWAEVLDEGSSNLSGFRPFTSKDCDIVIDGGVIPLVEKRSDGILVKGDSPADGQVAIFKTSHTPPMVVDFLSAIYGISPDRNRKLFDRAVDYEGILVMDPLSLLQSKCACFIGLDQRSRQDEKHSKMLIAMMPFYFKLLLQKAESTETSERQLIREVKYLAMVTKILAVRRTLQEFGCRRVSLVPIDRMKASELPKLNEFANSSLISLLNG